MVCFQGFAATKFCHLSVQKNASGGSTLKFELTSEPPEALPLIIGDAIHNLRSALDHIWARLYRVLGLDDSDVYFPFKGTRESLEPIAC
jgi:hypothetical protein